MARSYAGIKLKLGSIRDGVVTKGKLIIQSYGDPFVAVLDDSNIEHELEEFVPEEFINNRVRVEVSDVYQKDHKVARVIHISLIE